MNYLQDTKKTKKTDAWKLILFLLSLKMKIVFLWTTPIWKRLCVKKKSSINIQSLNLYIFSILFERCCQYLRYLCLSWNLYTLNAGYWRLAAPGIFIDSQQDSLIIKQPLFSLNFDNPQSFKENIQ